MTPSNSELDFLKEEYKLILGSLIVIEDRILKVFTGTVAVNITLLSAILSYVFKTASPYSTEEAYILLIPVFLLVPSFLLVLSLRMDLSRGAAYLLVFIEERRLGPSWGTHLTAFRKGPSSDSLDTMPYTYFVLAAVSCGSFVYVLRQSTSAVIHYWPFVVVAVFFYKSQNDGIRPKIIFKNAPNVGALLEILNYLLRCCPRPNKDNVCVIGLRFTLYPYTFFKRPF